MRFVPSAILASLLALTGIASAQTQLQKDINTVQQGIAAIGADIAALPAGPVNSVVFGVVDVRTFGATGDGATNDEPAIQKAVAALAAQGYGTLRFPAGNYRVTTPGDGLLLKGLSNIAVEFQAGATLVLDNLDATGKGTGSGILVQGPASNISIRGAYIKWAHVPSSRSNGDGIRFEGYPSDAGTISDIRVVGAHVENAPQTGCVAMGCSDVRVADFSVANNLADGLHFNACRRISVLGVNAVNTGDDSLAFVTYYDPKNVNVYPGTTGGPYAQPSLGDWNNSGVVTNVISEGSHANGVRVWGANRLAISNISVKSAAVCGVVVGSCIADSGPNPWSAQASTGLVISNVDVDGASTGFFCQIINTTFGADSSFWKYRCVLSNLTTANCSNDALNVTNADGWSVMNARGVGRVRFINDRNILVTGLLFDQVPLWNGTTRAVGQ